MSLIKPFRALRPRRDVAAQVASPPYDVLNRQEARDVAGDNALSFLHINKPDIDLDDSVGVYDQAVYEQGAANLRRFIDEGVLQRDAEARFYVYKQIMGSHEQIGLVAVASIEAYENDLIKKHEFTRPDKEDDRVAHMDALDAQVGPVFLTYRARQDVDALIEEVVQQEAEYDFTADDNTRHQFWVVADADMNERIAAAFSQVDHLYVADGHHRSAAAARVRKLRQDRSAEHGDDESYDYFLVVVFPDKQMQILDYNRVVKDLNGLTAAEFLTALGQSFTVEQVADRDMAKPEREKEFGLYLEGQWYRLVAAGAEEGDKAADPVKHLDVTVMQDLILTPILGIEDQRTDSRVDFVGGIRGLQELEGRVDSGQWRAAIALHPIAIESLLAIADAGQVMPPKTTWFEPKLRSGLIVHVLD